MKTKHISREKYIETFCRDKRIRERQVLYVSAETHNRIRRVAHLFEQHHVTVASLIDTILIHHLETYGQIFEELNNEQVADFLGKV
ncbi:DUF3408 domain-containing protein [Bacteroides neonati]|uniref:DUF3408 domain-containing protein n=1 Tax=Bacteroides neonati TaxID=1347393 RepID=UPI0004AF7B2B|nr:DUF3408 domain-containing protein [Bacteroides neonati]